jgi:hypothetical protein
MTDLVNSSKASMLKKNLAHLFVMTFSLRHKFVLGFDGIY